MNQLGFLTVSADTIPEAWEKAVLAVYQGGTEIKTEYDKPEDPPSLDATVAVLVRNPMGEPRIHNLLRQGNHACHR